MKNLMKAAHKLAKEIKAEFPEVDYKAQLGICISYLSKEGEKAMVELKGSEKQIKWAEELRKVVTNWVNQGIEKAMPKFSEKNLKTLEELIKVDMDNDSAAYWIETFKGTKEDNLRPLFDYLNNSKICGRKIASAINEIREV